MGKIKLNCEKIVGYILLIPPMLSVLIFLYQLFTGTETLHSFLVQSQIGIIGTSWTGLHDFNDIRGAAGGSGGGFTSALPLYFGLMAIAGAYLIKDSTKKLS